jgi:hypothetical protein
LTTLLRRSRLRLGRNGLVAYEPGTATTVRLDRRETVELLRRDIPFDSLDEPCEIVHLEISNRCNLRCPYCYSGRKEGNELSTEQWKNILDGLAPYGIFQVTFGGGEPTLREDLKVLALHARRKGLNLCMTTNGVLLPQLGPETLCLFNQVNISYHGDAPLAGKALAHLEAHGVQRGINFLAACRFMAQLPLIATVAEAFDAELLLLAGKGMEDALPPKAVMAEARKLHGMGVRVAVDGLTCSGELPDYCMQKRRFCDVDSVGNVMPCSFVREPMGNLLERPFAGIWRSRGRQTPCPFIAEEAAGKAGMERSST